MTLGQFPIDSSLNPSNVHQIPKVLLNNDNLMKILVAPFVHHVKGADKLVVNDPNEDESVLL